MLLKLLVGWWPRRKTGMGPGIPVLVISFCLAIGLSAPCGAATANAPTVAQSYVFVSANTRSRMSVEDARQSFDSFEQENAAAVADHIACSLTHSVQIADALGVYAESSENSFVIRTNLPADLSQYLASLFGRYAHQEFVLSFTRKQNGPDRLWIVDTDRPLAEVISAIRALKLVPATVRDDHGRIEIYFVEFGPGGTQKPKTLASRLHGNTSVAEGVAALRGDEDRARAAAAFDDEIQDIEQRGRYHLSSHLWSENWHDATSRTCSEGFSDGK